MGPADLLIHLLNFVAPAFFIALAADLGARAGLARGARGRPWWLQPVINFAGGVMVLAAGLWFFRQDGKMATYAALVVVVALLQWLGSRGWRA